MNVKNLRTLAEVSEFLRGSAALEPVPGAQAERYAWIAATLRHFDYKHLSRANKGRIRRYLGCVTGYSRQQVTRLIRRWCETGRLRWEVKPARGFARRFTDADIRLLAEVDRLHDTPSGPAVKKLCERAWEHFGDERYARLATISVSHLYNLRHSRPYRRRRGHFEATRPVSRAIGVRKKPDPQGRPGFIRIDTVHQGDKDGVKGLYHINAVDEVTQFEVVATVERISERFLIPVLAEMLKAFPFVILAFHADNGSEYINHRVAELLEKLRIELTKSRARHTNDNALAESKNAAVVRKILGYVHIPQRFAPEVNRFNQDYLTPYLNYHRPCFFPEIVTDAKGKERKRYPYKAMMTPYGKLKSLPKASQYLKSGLNFDKLDAIADAISDNEAARRLQIARQTLFETLFERRGVG
jgi:transposase InsO family protein